MVTPEKARELAEKIDPIDRMVSDLENCVGNALRDLASQVERLQADAERWKYARDYLSMEDVKSWSIEMKGHVPIEEESARTDAAIDSARKQS